VSHGGAQHRSCVSMDDEQECRYWTEKLGCSEDELAAAVARVGSSPDAVRHELYRHWAYGTVRVDERKGGKAIISARSRSCRLTTNTRS
jgi:Protein of unknown function (DUF3606)